MKFHSAAANGFKNAIGIKLTPR